MNARVDQLLDEAFGLPVDERSAVAAALIDSLEGSADASIAQAWKQELLRRREALRNGTEKALPWAEVRAAPMTRCKPTRPAQSLPTGCAPA